MRWSWSVGSRASAVSWRPPLQFLPMMCLLLSYSVLDVHHWYIVVGDKFVLDVDCEVFNARHWIFLCSSPIIHKVFILVAHTARGETKNQQQQGIFGTHLSLQTDKLDRNVPAMAIARPSGGGSLVFDSPNEVSEISFVFPIGIASCKERLEDQKQQPYAS